MNRFPGDKLCLVKTTKISQTICVRIGLRKVRRHPHLNPLQRGGQLQINILSLVHYLLTHLLRMDSRNQFGSLVILPAPRHRSSHHNNTDHQCQRSAVHSPMSTTTVEVPRMDPIMLLNTLAKAGENPPPEVSIKPLVNHPYHNSQMFQKMVTVILLLRDRQCRGLRVMEHIPRRQHLRIHRHKVVQKQPKIWTFSDRVLKRLKRWE